MEQKRQEVSEQIQDIISQSDVQVTRRLQQNRVNDLDSILKSRDRLHCWNTALIYLFHFTQTAGIFIVSLATSLEMTKLVFIGVGFNFLASVFEAIRQVNTKISARELKDLEKIKLGTYIDEGDIDFQVQQQQAQQQSRQRSSQQKSVLYKSEIAAQMRNADDVESLRNLTKLVQEIENIQEDQRMPPMSSKKIEQPEGDQIE